MVDRKKSKENCQVAMKYYRRQQYDCEIYKKPTRGEEKNESMLASHLMNV